MKQLLISEAAYTAICEAADVLRRIHQGHLVGYAEEEVKHAAQDLQAIQYITPTWEDRKTS